MVAGQATAVSSSTARSRGFSVARIPQQTMNPAIFREVWGYERRRAARVRLRANGSLVDDDVRERLAARNENGRAGIVCRGLGRNFTVNAQVCQCAGSSERARAERKAAEVNKLGGIRVAA